MKKNAVALFTRPVKGKLLSSLIMTVDDSEFSHCAVYFHESEAPNVYEATWPKTRLVTMETFMKGRELMAYVPCFADESFLSKHLGKYYSVAQLFAIALNRITFGWFKPSINNDHLFVCSEYVGESVGMPKGDYTTPKEVHQWLLSKYYPDNQQIEKINLN